ncbi:MAG: DUF885 domain-containing protein [Actinobacteria bacterium]|nr:DUF885 domain-containing protein [Actinomycetota bacterium]
MAPLETADRLTRRYLDAVIEHQPVEATAIGEHARDRDLPDLAPEAVDGWTRQVSVLLGEVRGARAGLPASPSGDDREADGDLAMLEDSLAGTLFWLEDRRRLATDPLAALATASSGIHELLRRTDLPDDEQRELVSAAASRARSIPRYIEQAAVLIESSPRPHLEVAMSRLQGFIELVGDELPRRTEELGGDVLAARDAGEVATEALGAFGAFLSELGEQEPTDWRMGPEDHAKALRFVVGTDMEVDEIAARARRLLDDVTAEMAEDAGELLAARGSEVPRDAEERTRRALEVIARDAVGRSELMDAAREAVRTTHRWAADTGIVDLPPAELLTVTEVPQFLQGVAVAFITSPPALEPESGCTYYLSPVPDSWEEERAASFLAEYNRHALLSLALHEAVPGHWVQLEHAARHPRLTRRWMWSSAFAEGWAVHIERTAVRMGFGDEVDDVDGAAYRLSQRKLELRLAANALLDVGLHAGDLDDDGAMRLLTGETFQQEAEATGKLVRAKVTSGQLCSYFVGGEEFADLEAEERRRAGADFDLARFHRRVLAHGTPTTAIVRAALAEDPDEPAWRPFGP